MSNKKCHIYKENTMLFGKHISEGILTDVLMRIVCFFNTRFLIPDSKIHGVVIIIFISVSSHGQQLSSFLKEAAENNPDLKAAQYEFEASEEKTKEVSGLPNTTLGAGYFISEPETRMGPQKARVSIQQQVPWFGTIKSRKETAVAMSEVDKNNIEVVKRKIFLGIEKKYYEMYGLKAKQKILLQQEELLETYTEIAISALANNRASTIDVLKLNIAKNNLRNEQEILKGTLLTAETEFNQLLHRDGFETLEIGDNLIIPDEEPTMALDDITYHPELMTYDYLEEVFDRKVENNTKEALPSIGLGLDYIVVQKRSDMEMPDNGKDVIMPMVTLSVPIFSKKYRSRFKQYKLQKEAVVQQRASSQNTLEIMMEKAINDRITSRINYNTYVQNIEQANQAEKIAQTIYQTGRIDFEEILDIQDMILTFQKKKIDAIRDYFTQSAILNYLR